METTNPLLYFPLLRKDHNLPAHHGGRVTEAYLVSRFSRGPDEPLLYRMTWNKDSLNPNIGFDAMRCDAILSDLIRFDAIRNVNGHLTNRRHRLSALLSFET